MAKVVITGDIGDEAEQLIQQEGLSVVHNQSGEPWSTATLIEQAQGAQALITLLTDRVDTAVLDALPDLKVVANVAVGYDNIDVAAATERGVVVTNTPDVLTETTADLAFALLLAIARRIPEADAYMRAGKYERFEMFPDMLGVDVYGKTLGIVGMGRIGYAIGRRAALGFGMPVLYSGRSHHAEAEQALDAKKVPLAELLAQSDFVSISVPLTKETRHMFTLETLKQMKRTACLINTSRGPVIKEADLVTALQDGVIRGAALDVFEHEPQMEAGLKAIRDRLVVTPHVGSATIETRRRMAQTAVANALAVLNGRLPKNPLNPEVLKTE